MSGTTNEIPEKKKPDPDELLTLKRCCAEVPLSLSALYEAISNNVLTHYRLSPTGKKGSGKIAVRRRDLLAWVESQRVEADGAGEGEYKHLR
jgi:hypothetical protein